MTSKCRKIFQLQTAPSNCIRVRQYESRSPQRDLLCPPLASQTIPPPAIVYPGDADKATLCTGEVVSFLPVNSSSHV